MTACLVVPAGSGEDHEDARAAARVAELRARFRTALAAEPRAGAEPSARVKLPMHANGAVLVEDEGSRVSVSFVLANAHPARIRTAGGLSLYENALEGSDVLHRVHAEGTEDFVVFETRPAREELAYVIDVSRAAGLRVVASTLELLDGSGTPRLRVARPYVVDARGERRDATLALDGCAFDASPAAPWGRTPTPPGASHCTLRVAWSGSVSYPVIVDPAWTTTGSMTVVRSTHTANVLPSGKVLVAGGIGGGPTPYASAELYDPATGTFAVTGSMGNARTSHAAAVLASGKVLVAGGRASNRLASAELYDPVTGTFTPTGSLVTARSHLTSSVLLSGKVLVAGGLTPDYVASVELYDPSTGTFSPTGALVTPRYLHTATVLASGSVLVVGGRGETEGSIERDLATAELYDPEQGTFTPTGSLATPRRGHTASVLGSGKVLVAGGRTASAEVYDPAAGAFVDAGSLSIEREHHTATVLASGKVLVAGGSRSGGTIQETFATAEIYDPSTSTFASGGSMGTPRFSHTASLLASGKVLVAGGGTGSTTVTASAELFALASGVPCAAGDVCASGSCVDGFCCDTPCTGQCEACDVAKGSCVRVGGAPHGSREPCASGNDCSAVTGRCEPREGAATCDGDHTTTGADGTSQDCTPYRCNPDGTCRRACTSVNDCVAPAVCETSGSCVLLSEDEEGEGGGCAVAEARPRGTSGALHAGSFAFVVAVGAARRRRRMQGRGDR